LLLSLLTFYSPGSASIEEAAADEVEEAVDEVEEAVDEVNGNH